MQAKRKQCLHRPLLAILCAAVLAAAGCDGRSSRDRQPAWTPPAPSVVDEAPSPTPDRPIPLKRFANRQFTWLGEGTLPTVELPFTVWHDTASTPPADAVARVGSLSRAVHAYATSRGLTLRRCGEVSAVVVVFAPYAVVRAGHSENPPRNLAGFFQPPIRSLSPGVPLGDALVVIGTGDPRNVDDTFGHELAHLWDYIACWVTKERDSLDAKEQFARAFETWMHGRKEPEAPPEAAAFTPTSRRAARLGRKLTRAQARGEARR